MGGLITLQKEALAHLRPAQWLGFLHKQNRASVVWVVPRDGVEASSLLEILENEAERGGYEVAKGRIWEEKDSEMGTCTQHLPPVYFSTKAGWLDVVDIEMDARDAASSYVTLTSSSTSWLPAVVPLAPLLAPLFAWVVFFDHGANLHHLEHLHRTVEHACGRRIWKQILYPGKVLRWIEYVIVFLLFAITAIATVLNVFFDHYLALNVVVTFICVTLTVHTFITLLCACLQRRLAQTDPSWTGIQT